MGYVFDVADKTFWSPSQNVGRILMAENVLLEQVTGVATGLVETMSDTVEVDLKQLQQFEEALISHACWENQSLRCLLHGVRVHLIAILIAHDSLSDYVRRELEGDLLFEAKAIAQGSMNCSF